VRAGVDALGQVFDSDDGGCDSGVLFSYDGISDALTHLDAGRLLLLHFCCLQTGRTTRRTSGIADGSSHPGETGRHQSFPDYLQALIDQDQRLYHVVNEGVSGDTTTDGVQRLPNVLADQPRVVILEFGGNDGLRGLPVKTTRANLEQMIVALQKSGAKVVLAGMTLPRNYGQEYIHPFEQMYVALARQYHLSRIPFLLNGVASDPKLMQPDSIHPTAKGNAIVAKTVYQYVKPLL
jgi:acyl-CoA thioesterase-1